MLNSKSITEIKCEYMIVSVCNVKHAKGNWKYLLPYVLDVFHEECTTKCYNLDCDAKSCRACTHWEHCTYTGYHQTCFQHRSRYTDTEEPFYGVF